MYGGNGREDVEGRSIGTEINSTGFEVFAAVLMNVASSGVQSRVVSM
jgi:hypothetical protein